MLVIYHKFGKRNKNGKFSLFLPGTSFTMEDLTVVYFADVIEAPSKVLFGGLLNYYKEYY